MTVDAAQIQYRQEYIQGFEQRNMLLRGSTTTEAVIKGNQATFLVADSNSATAVTRGANGLIPAKTDNETQNTATLQEWHDLRRKTRFNIFASQGDQRRIMQDNSLGVMNRKVDEDILGVLAGATQDSGEATTGSLELIMHAKTILGNNEVDITDGNVFAVISPAFHAYLMQTKEFASIDYVGYKPFEGQMGSFGWCGLHFIVHPNLTGKGTAAEICYMYHRNAIGHAIDSENFDIKIGYDEEQDYSFARCTGFMGSVLLQNTGIVKITHDGSAYAAT